MKAEIGLEVEPKPSDEVPVSESPPLEEDDLDNTEITLAASRPEGCFGVSQFVSKLDNNKRRGVMMVTDLEKNCKLKTPF